MPLEIVSRQKTRRDREGVDLAARSARAAAAISLVTGLWATAGLTGCPSDTTATGYTPITGIEILSSSLVSGHGCGTGPGQVYRYAAVVSYAADAGGAASDAGQLPVANVFDCFVDGVFESLPASSSGSQSFAITIFAYDRTSFPASLNCPPAGGPCPAQDPRAIGAVAGQATWTTTCTATQQQGIPVLAVCGPLLPPSVMEAGAVLEAGGEGGGADGGQGDAGSDGAALVDGPVETSVEGSVEAGADTATAEAGLDGTADSPSE